MQNFKQYHRELVLRTAQPRTLHEAPFVIRPFYETQLAPWDSRAGATATDSNTSIVAVDPIQY